MPVYRLAIRRTGIISTISTDLDREALRPAVRVTVATSDAPLDWTGMS
jgi:hypothetical protein